MLAFGGLSTNVTSVCQWLARPSSLSTGRIVRRAVDGGHRRVGFGQLAEARGEALLAFVVEFGVPEHQGLVLVQGVGEERHLGGVEVACRGRGR